VRGGEGVKSGKYPGNIDRVRNHWHLCKKRVTRRDGSKELASRGKIMGSH